MVKGRLGAKLREKPIEVVLTTSKVSYNMRSQLTDANITNIGGM
jgi:hypothetical protein